MPRISSRTSDPRHLPLKRRSSKKKSVAHNRLTQEIENYNYLESMAQHEANMAVQENESVNQLHVKIQEQRVAGFHPGMWRKCWVSLLNVMVTMCGCTGSQGTHQKKTDLGFHTSCHFAKRFQHSHLQASTLDRALWDIGGAWASACSKVAFPIIKELQSSNSTFG